MRWACGPLCACCPVRQAVGASLTRTLGIREQPRDSHTFMNTTILLFASFIGFALIGCAATKAGDSIAPQPVERASLPFSSAECLAAKLPPGEPFPASAIPSAAQSSRQSGVVAIRYDVVGGVAQNLQVVSSKPVGLYDTAAMQHAAKYRAPASSTVRGCVTIIEVKF